MVYVKADPWRFAIDNCKVHQPLDFVFIQAFHSYRQTHALGVVNKLWKLTFISHVMGLFFNHFEHSFFRSQTIQKQVPGWIWFRSYSVPTSHEPKADRWKKIPRFPRAHVKLALQSLPHPEPTANSRLCHHTRDKFRVSRTLYLAMLPTLRNLVCLLPYFNLYFWDKSFTVTDWSGTHLYELRVHRACLYLSSARLLAQAKLPCFSLCILGT